MGRCRGMTLARSVLGLIMIALVASACSAHKSDDGTNATIKFAGASKTPELKPGTDYHVVDKVPSVIDGARVNVFGRLDDRTAYGSMPSEKAPATQGTEPMRLVSIDTRTGRATTLADHGSDKLPPYILDATANAKYIVWTEIHDTTLETMRWDIYSLDRRNGQERHLASYKDLGAEKPPWPSIQGVTLQMIGSRVYFPVVEGADAKADWSGAIYGVTDDGSTPAAKVIDDATQAWADGRKLWFERDGSPGLWDEKGRARVVATKQKVDDPCGMFVREGVVVQCDGRKRLVITEQSGKVTTIVGLPVRPTYLNATKRWVGFNSGDSTAYVYDLKRQHLARVDDAMMKVDRNSGPELSVLKLSPSSNDAPYEVWQLQ